MPLLLYVWTFPWLQWLAGQRPPPIAMTTKMMVPGARLRGRPVRWIQTSVAAGPAHWNLPARAHPAEDQDVTPNRLQPMGILSGPPIITPVIARCLRAGTRAPALPGPTTICSHCRRRAGSAVIASKPVMLGTGPTRNARAIGPTRKAKANVSLVSTA
jgi:hypothetical protein